jgi:hypothetical protein
MATAASLCPTLTFKSWLSTGQPNAFGTVNTYSAGTVTPIATYTDSTAVTPNANPLNLNARGEASIWLLPNVGYKLVEADSFANPIKTTDQVFNSQFLTLYGGVDTGIVNAYVLTFNANFTSITDGIVLYWIPSNTDTGPSTLTVNGLGPLAIVNSDGSALTPNELIANQPTTVISKGGNWILVSAGYPITGTFTATLASGWTTTPTLTLNYRRVGSWVSIYWSSISALTATSNAATAVISGIPAALRNSTAANIKASVCRVIDNGASKGGWGYIDNFGNITLGLGFDSIGGNFTTTGLKGIDAGWSINYVQS